MTNTTPMSKEAVKELAKIAKRVGVSLKDLLFGTGENIVILKNQAEKGNVSKAMQEAKITMESKIENSAMRSIIRVPDNYQSNEPIHFCFILDKKGTKQAVQPTWYIGKNAKVKIFAYCFGVEYEVKHGDGKIYHVGENSSLEVYEFNYNANESYMTVYNTFTAYLDDNAFFKNYYVSTVGHLGHGITRGKVYCKGKNSKAEFTTKNRILDKDVSDLDITFYLEGENSSGIINSRSVTHEGGTNKFVGTLVGIGDNTKGHMECDELSLGKCKLSTSPQLVVENPTSRLTHEASVGTVEKKAIENLLLKGFEEDDAIGFLVNGVLDSI